MTIHITDPTKTIERIYVRIYEAEQHMASAEADGFLALVPMYQRRISALRGAATRIARQYLL